jgi:hypothetical protein
LIKQDEVVEEELDAVDHLIEDNEDDFEALPVTEEVDTANAEVREIQGCGSGSGLDPDSET